MNVRILIDMIVRQTTVLIAHLATSAGLRAPLAHIANQVFLDLVNELEAQGLGRKVIADMFGLALRSYQLKVRRLSESSTEEDHSLWEAVFAWLQAQGGVVSRAKILIHFVRDDESVVRSVLHDLVESGLIFKTGRGDATAYRVATEEELNTMSAAGESLEALVWIWIYRHAPISEGALMERVGASPRELQQALARLVSEGRVERAVVDGEDVYRCSDCLLPLGSPVGFEAALFDHFQAMVAAFCAKLDQRHSALPRDVLGGSTWSFDVWPGHPHREEVYGLLGESRARMGALWDKVNAYNRQHRAAQKSYDKVTFYAGQHVRLGESDDADEARP
jgi:hypothetical protein